MITVAEIAKIAGVSKATVSLALNNRKGVSEEKKKQILKIADEHNYVHLKKNTKNNRSNTPVKTIRFLVCNNTNYFQSDVSSMPFFKELLSDFSTITETFPCALLLTSLNAESFIEDLTEIERNNPSDGIIFLGTDLSYEILANVKTVQPNVIIIDTFLPLTYGTFVTINNHQGMYLATQHLIDTGLKEIGYAQSSYQIYNFKERFKGYLDCLKDNNLQFNPDYLLTFPPNDMLAHPDIINSSSLPDAFVSDNDTIAISLIKSLQSLGYNVPKDISVIGFDNISESSAITPELTTIEVNRKELLTTAVKKIMDFDEIGSSISDQEIKISTTLIYRNSVLKK